MYRVPLVYTVRRPFKANGTSFARGAVLTNAQARPLRLGLLVSSGRLLADPDTASRRAHEYIGPQPTHVPGDAYPATTLTAGTITVTKDPDPGDELRVILDSSFPGPTGWAYGDGWTDSQQDNHTAHAFATAGTYAIVCQSRTHRATTSVTVPLAAGELGESFSADMTVAETVAWVGDDPERAQQALDAEQARDKPRSSLVSALNTILASGQDAPA